MGVFDCKYYLVTSSIWWLLLYFLRERILPNVSYCCPPQPTSCTTEGLFSSQIKASLCAKCPLFISEMWLAPAPLPCTAFTGSLSVSAGCSEITGTVTLVTKEATLCQSKAGPAVLVLCEPGAYCFPRNLVPSLGSRVAQQLLLQLQSCLSLRSLRIQEQSHGRPVTKRRKENFERRRWKGDDYRRLAEGNKSRKHSQWVSTSLSFSYSERHHP